MFQVNLYPNSAKNLYIAKSINNIKKSNINNKDAISFTGNNITIQKGNLSGELREAVINLIENTPTSDDENFLGEGAIGKAYKLSMQDKNVVVKVAKKKENTGIEKEASILEKLPHSLQKTGQSLVAYGLTKDGYEFLVTNLVEGKNNTIPENKEQLKSLILGNFLELDKAGILHGDAGEGNILINSNKNEVNLIDYGYAREFGIFNNNDERMPKDLMLNSNILLFEIGGLDDYLVKLSDDKKPGKAHEFFKNYLDIKADYHNERVNYLQEEFKKRQTEFDAKETTRIKNCINYEKVLSKILKNPSDEIIKMEAQRCQLLYSFNMANKNSFFNKPTDTITNWTRTIIYARKYKDTIQSKLNNCTDEDMKKYLEFQNQYADFYLKTFNNWGGGTINHIFNIFSNTNARLSEREKNIFNNGMQNPLTQLNVGLLYSDTIDIEKSINNVQ